jgi:hypothetical protein
MTDDIVARLRGKVEASSIYDDDEELLDAAADEIERQRADLADADRVIMRLNSGAELQAIMAAHNDALRERDALREALREKDNIVYIIDGHGIAHYTFTIVYREKTND